MGDEADLLRSHPRWDLARGQRDPRLRAVAKFDLNYTALAAYLRLGSIPHPLTAFEGIHELPPAISP